MYVLNNNISLTLRNYVIQYSLSTINNTTTIGTLKGIKFRKKYY